MANPDRRLGLIGAAGLGLAALGGGVVFTASANESQRLQAEQRVVRASNLSTGIESPRIEVIKGDLQESLFFSAAGGSIALLSVGGAAATTYINRRRPKSA